MFEPTGLPSEVWGNQHKLPTWCCSWRRYSAAGCYTLQARPECQNPGRRQTRRSNAKRVPYTASTSEKPAFSNRGSCPVLIPCVRNFLAEISLLLPNPQVFEQNTAQQCHSKGQSRTRSSNGARHVVGGSRVQGIEANVLEILKDNN